MNSQKAMEEKLEYATESTNAEQQGKYQWKSEIPTVVEEAEEMRKAGKEHELTRRIEIESTPFQVVEVENHFKVLWGNWSMSEWYQTEKEAIEYAKKIDWNKIMLMMNVALNNFEQQLKLK